MQKIKHTKGKHSTKPIKANIFFNAKKKTLIWNGYFTEEAKYDFVDPNDEDEKDWSKWCGVSFCNIINAQKNSIMCAWRYHDKLDEIQLAPYYHDEKGNTYYPGKGISIENILPVILNKTFQVTINVEKLEIIIEQNDRKITTKCNGVDPTWLAREINSWFGGTDPAPYDFNYWKTKIKIV